MNRRAFLRAGGVLTVAFASGCSLPVIPKRPEASLEAAAGWVGYRDGRYELVLPRVEIGQNIATAFRQIACDELGIGWGAIDVRPHDTAGIAPVKASVGSVSVEEFALPLARACATLREAVADGAAGRDLAVTERPASALTSMSSTTGLVGQRVPLDQGTALVTGQPLYAADTRLPGMRFGRVLRASVTPELASRPLRWNTEAAKAVPGFVAVIEHRRLRIGRARGLGIVAATPGALDRVEAALAVEWDVDGHVDQRSLETLVDIDRRLARGALAETLAGDDIDPDAPWDVELRVDVPLAAHGSIEPRAAVAWWDESEGLRVWAGSQDAFYVRDAIAKRLRLDPSRVVVQSCRVGGAFGGKAVCNVELEAAVLSRATGVPIKVQWTRAQELRTGYHRPASSHRVRARMENGRLTHWWHGLAGGNVLLTNAVLPSWLQIATSLIGDRGVGRGALPPYAIERQRVEIDVVRLPVMSGPWRGLGAGPNVFAVESAIDECARHAGRDPVRFRLAHIDEPRLEGVLTRVAADARWQDVGADAVADVAVRRGRGVACGVYKANSFAAVIADVEVDADGAVRVTRLWCAHDCGRVINPDQVAAQCEGNLVWGIGMALLDGLTIEDSGVAATGFDGAPIPRLSEVPPMSVAIVEDPRLPPSGAGETVIVASAASLGLSSRSLQRALSAADTTFSTVLRERRVTVAAELLRDTDRSLADIGFACGFSDQPHFQREFVRTLNLTPGGYRAL